MNTSGQADLTTAVTGVLPLANTSAMDIAHGGTNNASLAVTAGGVVYTDGSKLVNVGAGTSGYYLQSNGASAPTWTAVVTNSMTLLGTLTTTSGTTQTLSGLNLTTYKQLLIEIIGVSHNSGTSQSFSVTLADASIFVLTPVISPSAALYASICTDLASGSSIFYGDNDKFSTKPGYVRGFSGILSSQTSLTFSWSGGSFDAGSINVYGVK